MRVSRYSLVVIAVASTVAISTLASCRAEGDRPGVIVLPGMVYSVPYDSFGENAVTGVTMLLPPEGTVPIGFHPFLYGPGKDEAARAARELSSPLSLGEESETHLLRRGQEVYDTFCQVCHGPAGEGDGPIIGRFPNPPSLLGKRSMEMADGQIYHVIFHGQGLMPSYAVQVREMDRWRVVAYVRSLQKPLRSPESASVAKTIEEPQHESTEKASAPATEVEESLPEVDQNKTEGIVSHPGGLS